MTLRPEQRQKELVLAARLLRAALVQAPDFFYPNLNLGMVHANRHEHQLADQYFAQAVRSDPNQLTARERWADALVEQGRIREAAYRSVAAIQSAPDNADLRIYLANFYLEVNPPDAAKTQLEQAHVIDPTRAGTLLRTL